MQIKGIFFDLYGTLLVYEDLDQAWEKWQKAFYLSMNARGASLDQGRINAIASEIFDNPMLYRENHLTPYEYRLKEIAAKIGLDLNNADLREIAQTTVTAWNEHISLDPEAVSVRIYRFLSNLCLTVVRFQQQLMKVSRLTSYKNRKTGIYRK